MDKMATAFRICVAAKDLDAFVEACGRSEWGVLDTGERVMTDEGPDGEAILLVAPEAARGEASRLALAA